MSHVFHIVSTRLTHCLVGMDVPFAREKVITCYGIIGILSLATSASPLWVPSALHTSGKKLN